MRRYRKNKRRGGSDGSFWLSFSDLMSALVLIFMLILFYSMYQYFDMYEIKEAELARQQFDLNEANQQLAAEQQKLSEAEKAMIAQQIKLQAAEDGLAATEDILDKQKTALDEANALLSDKEEELNQLSIQLQAQAILLSDQQTTLQDQQTILENQQAALEYQQRQLEALTGMRTRIVVALSDALRASSISASVDPATGSITLESDVLFDKGNALLSDAGKRNIDAFLPVYLKVLLSEEYRPYISEILIEGHTDSAGGYIMNLELSQQRALAVASYILDDSYHVISAAQKETLREITTANGRSYSDRIVVNGVEDQDASRRVVFKFRLTDEQMIEQLKRILEENSAAGQAAIPQETPAPAPQGD